MPINCAAFQPENHRKNPFTKGLSGFMSALVPTWEPAAPGFHPRISFIASSKGNPKLVK